MTTELCNAFTIHGQPTERDWDFYNQGYEAGLRRAASLVDTLTIRIGGGPEHYAAGAHKPWLVDAILAEIK